VKAKEGRFFIAFVLVGIVVICFNIFDTGLGDKVVFRAFKIMEKLFNRQF